MHKYFRYLIVGVSLVAIGLILWYFIAIVAYILIAVILSFVGRPIVDLLRKIRFKKFQFPDWLAATISLIILWGIIITFFYVFVPLVSNETKVLSEIDINQIETNLREPINNFEIFLEKFTGKSDIDIEKYISENIYSIISKIDISGFFDSFTNIIAEVFIAFFSISFIAFFFLRDSNLFVEGVMTFIPSKHEEKVRNVFSSVKKLLVRYFLGLTLEVFLVMTLDTLGLIIVGINFENALVIGLLAGMLNVIPYIGPIVGGILGLIIGATLNIDLDFYSELLPLMGFMAIVFVVTQIIDNIVFQPLIYSNSVHAHPLEIFLVILIAGSAFGILGMILAIPGYTILRVIGREFFDQYELVNKLTQNLEKKE